jgi:hypothetical protein
MPSNPRVPTSQKLDFRRYARMLLGLVAMIHDIGKIRTDVDYRFYNKNGRPIAVSEAYDPDGFGGLYSQTLYEYVRHVIGEEPESISYSWRYRSGRDVNGHDTEWIRALDGILMATGVQIPSNVRQAYLDTNSSLWPEIIKLKRQADHQSVQQFIESERSRDAVGRFQLHPEAIGCVGILYWLASHGYLDDLPKYKGSFFLSTQRISNCSAALPNFDDFGRVPRNALVPEDTADTFRQRGLTSEYPECASPNYKLCNLDGLQGVFLFPTVTGWIEQWQHPNEQSDFVDEEIERAVIEHRPPPQQEVLPQTIDTDDSSSATSSPLAEAEYEDVSSFGESIPPPHELSSQPEPSQTTHAPAASHPKGLAPLDVTYPEAILAVASYIQRLDEEELNNPEICHLDDGMLFIEGIPILSILKPYCVYTVEQFRKMCEPCVADRWRVQGDEVLMGLLLLPRYTDAVLDPHSTDILLLPMIDSDVEPGEESSSDDVFTNAALINSASSSTVNESSEPSAPETPPQPPTLEAPPEPATNAVNVANKGSANQYSLAGFCEKMANSEVTRNATHLVLVDGLLRVSLKAIDDYIDSPHNRGLLINVLSADGAFVKRSKKYFYLDSENEVISEWLSRLPVQR